MNPYASVNAPVQQNQQSTYAMNNVPTQLTQQIQQQYQINQNNSSYQQTPSTQNNNQYQYAYNNNSVPNHNPNPSQGYNNQQQMPVAPAMFHPQMVQQNVQYANPPVSQQQYQPQNIIPQSSMMPSMPNQMTNQTNDMPALPPMSNYWKNQATIRGPVNPTTQDKPIVSWSDLEPEKMDLYYTNN